MDWLVGDPKETKQTRENYKLTRTRVNYNCGDRAIKMMMTMMIYY